MINLGFGLLGRIPHRVATLHSSLFARPGDTKHCVSTVPRSKSGLLHIAYAWNSSPIQPKSSLISWVLPLVFFLFGSFLSAQETEPNFHQDIAPIIFSKCSPCHQKGGIGPMPFTSYKQVAAYAQMIAYVTKEKYMPPWRADPNYRHFNNENVLTEKELGLIQQWVIDGAPEGEKTENSVSLRAPNHIEIKQPDLQIGMAESFEQYGIYYDQFQTFVLETKLKEDQAIRAIEFVPGDPTIVRHCSVALDLTDAAIKEDDWDPRYGYFSYGGWGFVPQYSEWYSWSIGEGALYLPDGFVKYLPAGAKLVAHIHYGPTGVKKRDSSYFNFVFAKAEPEKEFQTLALLNPYTITNGPLEIAAGEKKRFFSTTTLPQTIDLYEITPNSLLLARTWEIYAKLPEKRNPIKLLKIADWDYKWKQTYRLSEPIRLPKGSTLHALVSYDNSSDNPYNPISPPTNVDWGKKVYQEMLLAHFGFITIEEHPHNNFHFKNLAPNHNKQQSSFELEVKKKGNYSIQLENSKGELIRTILEDKSLDKGQHHIKFYWKGLTYGLYQVVVQELKRKETAQRMIVYWGEEKI